MLDYAKQASETIGADLGLDRNICIAFNYLKGRVFEFPLVLLANGSLASQDGLKLGLADNFTASVDAVDQLRVALFPASVLNVSLVAALDRHYECIISAQSARGASISEFAQGVTEPLVRLTALLKLAAVAESVPVLS
ncbi:hypothetical protein GCM10007874_36100 [Labrys miyagiensis]|uniref:Uncharacterized protein n=2 Tax=Labrys miyagiensis TaxID=346912 RepID=A0ABQ6CJX9_9HYPH|nr:hypothetical protein GCM10007874_36100 [Labrys miyagiensis]